MRPKRRTSLAWQYRFVHYRGSWGVASGDFQPDGLVREAGRMVKFLLWCILLVLCWPVALLALVLYPLVWLLLLPFRLLGIAVSGVLELLRGIILLPARVLRGPRGM